MKYKWPWLLLAGVIFLGSLICVLFPVINRIISDRRTQESIQSFVQYIAPEEDEEDPAQPGEQLEGRRFAALWDACTQYNRQLVETEQENFDADSVQLPPFDLSQYGWEQEVFAVLSIPSIQADLPLYLGSSYDQLLLGGTILGQTSLPIGGESTNCVICGHRTWHGDDKLRHIDDVKLGDTVFILNPWELLIYQVVDIQTILPTDSDKLVIQPGRDLISIFTCTPVHQTSHRYLLICERSNLS